MCSPMASGQLGLDDEGKRAGLGAPLGVRPLVAAKIGARGFRSPTRS